MGQKTHPYAFRLGVVNDWKSKWYSDKNYVALVNEDWQIREFLRKELTRGAVSRIDIERTRDRLIVDVHTARPGVVIGRRGSEAERLRSALEKMTGEAVKFNVNEVKDPDLDATLLARGIADQLENRIAFRRAMKRAVASAMKAGAEGVRVEAKGRLGGSEMGRREWYREGRVPLHTIRADIDFGRVTAHTTAGTLGVKVWVYKGDVIGGRATSGDKIAAEVDLATGTPARRQSVKSRAEAAAEGERKPRLIEAGGGKRLVETGTTKREGGRRIIEAGGGRQPTAAEAQEAYEEEKEVVDPDAEAPEGGAPAEGVDTPATETPAEGADTPVTDTPDEGSEAAPDAPTESIDEDVAKALEETLSTEAIDVPADDESHDDESDEDTASATEEE